MWATKVWATVVPEGLGAGDVIPQTTYSPIKPEHSRSWINYNPIH